MYRVRLASALVAAKWALSQQTGEHTDWPRWCGKVYQPEYPSFEPGGETVEPERLYNPPRLDVKFSPLFAPYEEGDPSGTFIVDALLSPYRGIEWPSPLPDHWDEEGYTFYYTIDLVEAMETGLETLLVDTSMPADTKASLSQFSLTSALVGMVPRIEPYDVVLRGGKQRGSSDVEVKSRLWYLPMREKGSTTILNHDTGGLWIREAGTKAIRTLTPYGFYAAYDGFLGKNDSIQQIDRYAALGLNAMCPLTRYEDGREQLEYMEEIGMYVLYDLREIYTNLTAVEETVKLARDADNLFAYWLSDEPDGWQDPFNATLEGYNLIKKLDPYHPVVVVLNCQNYYYGPYSAGADIVVPDVYPIGTFYDMSKWGTTCNATYGDCGCDNCVGSIRDVSSRLDDLAMYDEWLGVWRKPRMFSPQSFHGEGYWQRDPTPEEAWAMSLLAFNHGAHGIISWVWPASSVLGTAHGELAKVVTGEDLSDFLVRVVRQTPVVTLGTAAVEQSDGYLSGSGLGIDAAYWAWGDRGELLLGIVNTSPDEVQGPFIFEFPGVELVGRQVQKILWGNITADEWTISEGKLAVASLPGMATCLLLLQVPYPCPDGACTKLQFQEPGQAMPEPAS